MSTQHEERQDKAPAATRLAWLLGGGDSTVEHANLVRRLRQIDSTRIRSALERRERWFRRWLVEHPEVERHAVFVVGSNRSGTQMVCEALGRSPHGWDYQESQANLAFKDYQLRSDWVINTLIRLSPAPIIGFGNILDSQFTDRLLERFSGSKAIWVYRRYQDAANSSVRKWGSHFKNDMVRWVARGHPERLGPRGQRIGEDTQRLFAEVFDEGLSDEDGACLYWYMRNRLFFDLNLHNDPRVLLVQYEDTVDNPEQSFRRISEFLHIPYDPSCADHVFSSSVGRHPWPGIDLRVKAACDTLLGELDEHYHGHRV